MLTENLEIRDKNASNLIIIIDISCKYLRSEAAAGRNPEIRGNS